MAVRYIIKAGDTLSKIAIAHGFHSYKDVYNHPENKAFRAKRPNPNLIYPGDVLMIPDKSLPMNYMVPHMVLIPQDKTMSCWYASGQMLIHWRQRTKQMTELAHPDPSLVKKWSKLYDNNPGISNNQIASFARDLGLNMLPPMTPTPEYMLQLLKRHGPLWINGNSHITVIAGIRYRNNGYEVLVYDPAKPALPHGKWHDFFQHYGLKANTALDASKESRTSMLHLK